jgi:hypothetical protein
VSTSVDLAELGRGVLVKARCSDGIQFLMLSPVRHHFVGVSAVVVALEAVEMAAGFLGISCQRYCKKDDNNKKLYKCFPNAQMIACAQITISGG